MGALARHVVGHAVVASEIGTRHLEANDIGSLGVKSNMVMVRNLKRLLMVVAITQDLSIACQLEESLQTGVEEPHLCEDKRMFEQVKEGL
jgi:hypothetical protein